MRLPTDKALVKAKDTKDLPLVQVVWKDHASYGAWRSLEVHRKESKPAEVTTVGLLISNHRSHIQVAQSVAKDGEAFNVFCILKSCIVRVRRLKEVGS